MAITIHAQPQKITPGYNSAILALSSTNQTKDGYQFVVDIFNTTTNEKIAREKLPPNPQGYGVFDIHRILENYVSFDLNPTLTGMTNCNNSAFYYYLSIGEEYKDTWTFNKVVNAFGYNALSSTTTTHSFSTNDEVLITFTSAGASSATGVYTAYVGAPDYVIPWVPAINYNQANSGGTVQYADHRKSLFTGLTSVTGLVVNNAAFSHLDYRNYNWKTWTLSASTAQTFNLFTDVPTNWKVREDERLYLNGYVTSLLNLSFIGVRTYSENGTIQGTYRLTSGIISKNYVQAGVGPWNINGTPIWAATGSTPVIKTSTTKYDVWLEDGFGAASSKPYTFQIDRTCSKYDPVSLVFMDRKGSFISKSFELASKETVNINRDEYKKIAGSFNGSSWTYNTYDRGRTIYTTDITRKVKATTNWMTEQNAAFMEQLFSSPEVYWNSGGTFIPIVITSNTWEEKTALINKLINYEIEFEYSNNDIIQRG